MQYMVKIGNKKNHVKPAHFVLTVECIGGCIVTELNVGNTTSAILEFDACVQQIFNFGKGLIGLGDKAFITQEKLWDDANLQSDFSDVYGLKNPKIFDLFRKKEHHGWERICVSMKLQFFDHSGIERDVLVYKKMGLANE